MAVNVSGRQIASANLIQHVAQSLAGSGLPPAALVLELTETVLVHDADRAARRLQELRSLGVRLAVDDFGTGYSSLSYLRQFPFDILKVDQSFVATITDADAMPAIVRGLLELGRTLGLETVAEGVEHVAQQDALRAHGCDLAQGYLFSRPLSPADAGNAADPAARRHRPCRQRSLTTQRTRRTAMSCRSRDHLWVQHTRECLDPVDQPRTRPDDETVRIDRPHGKMVRQVAQDRRGLPAGRFQVVSAGRHDHDVRLARLHV